MKRNVATALALGLLMAAPATAQEATTKDDANPPSLINGRPITIQYLRPADQRGVNVFETTKEPGVEYAGFRVDFGAAFATQLQSLDHENTALPNVVNGVNTNQLMTIGTGFNNSTANLALHAQLAKGVRVQLTAYLSARHHNETWVKDGYIQVDESPIEWVPLQALMQHLTLKVGHMEINYGDAHFRRSDNGNALYNPFVGNYILDAFTTEVGAEAYLKTKGIIAMAALTGGEVRGTVLNPSQRSFAKLGKVGVDRQVRKDLRLRLTGSLYKTDKAASSTLYGGDRAGSRYYFVMENTAATETAQFTSGLLNPGFRNEVTAMQLNPFVKFHGLEVFGVLERSEGKALAEAARREWRQYAIDTVYRLLPNEQLFVGARYNRVEGTLATSLQDIDVNRVQLAGGWFLTPSILMKAEYVRQKYNGFAPTDIRNGGKFHGAMFEGVVAF
jgi:hypothetical protein